MDIRKRNDDRDINKNEIKLRDVGEGILRVSGRARDAKASAKQIRDNAVINRMVKRGELKTRDVLATGRTKIEKEAIAGLTKQQRRAWKKLSAREQMKFLQKVEKKVDRKMQRMYPDKKQSKPGKRYHKGGHVNAAMVTNARQGVKSNVAKSGTSRGAPIIKAAVAKTGIVTGPSAGKGTAGAATKGNGKKLTPAKAKQLTALKRKRDRQKLLESEYKKQFEKKINRIRKDQRKEYKKEFRLTMARELNQIQQKDDAKKDIQRQLSIEQLQEQQLKKTLSVMAAPISTRVKMAFGHIMVKIAAMVASLAASAMTLLLPLLALLASLIVVINIVLGIVGFFSDDSSAGLPDAAYVKKTAVTWASYIAENDEKHGYNDGFFSRWGQGGDYGNCTFVVTAFDKSGLELKRAGATKVSKMYDAFTENGFLDVTDEISVSSGKGLEAGDVLIKASKTSAECRVEIIDKDGRMVGAVCDERGKQKGGQRGDQTGEEICTEKYKNLGWTYVLRYYGDMALYGGIGQELAEYACSFVGKFPYVYGGTSLVTGCDCSGFVQAVYAHFGYSIPRTAGSIYQYSRKLSRDMSTWQPGDIIYYSSTGTVQTGGGRSEHIGIYIGDGRVVQCGSGGVSIKDNYNYNGHFYGAGRILPDFDGSVALAGNNNAQKIWNYLRKVMGCSRAAAAGIIGNMYAECTTFNPAAIQPNGVGHGIVQWSYDRWYGGNGLEAYARKHGRSWSDLALQLSFFKYEVDNHIVGGVDYCIPGGWEKYKRMRQVSGSGGTVHLWFNAFEYNGGTFSYEWLMNEGEKNWAFRSRRLAFAISCYKDVKNYP